MHQPADRAGSSQWSTTIRTDPDANGKLFEPAPGTGTSFRYAEETKAQIVFVKDVNANGVADLGDEVWVRAAELDGAGILVEDMVQERGVQEVGFQQTGHQERGFQQRGRQSTGALDAYGNIEITNDPSDEPVFQLANGGLTFLDTGIKHVTVTGDAADGLLFLDFRSRLTIVDTGTQSVAVTGSESDGLLWRDVNGRRTTVDTGVQSIAVTNIGGDLALWIDALGNLTTVAGNAPVMNGRVQARGVHERTSSQQLLYLTENGTETTAVTDRPYITLTNDKFDDLLYTNASGNWTTDPGNRMAIRSAATNGQLGPNGLAVVPFWVEDDNERTTTNTQYKSFTGTPDGMVPGTGTAAPLLWTDQAGRKVDSSQFIALFGNDRGEQIDIVNGIPRVMFRITAIFRGIFMFAPLVSRRSTHPKNQSLVRIFPMRCRIFAWQNQIFLERQRLRHGRGFR